MDIPILFEDSDLIIVNKPSGTIVNKAQSVKEDTLQDWAEHYLRIAPPATIYKAIVREDGTVIRDIPAEFAGRAGIVHRIDKETSGCLVIAKTPHVFETLQGQFKQRMVKKTYLAIVHGLIEPAEGAITAPVGRLPWNREHFGIVPGGKEAVTRYKVHGSWFIVHGKNKEEITLVELFPETGRTHQIRVHLKYINHPIVGDYLYAGRKTSRDDRGWAPRVMLHAWKIEFVHPTSRERLAIEAPIPQDMNIIINNQ